MTQDMFPVEDEFDVSDAGVPTLNEVLATITDFEVEEKENGVQHAITFEVEGLAFPVTRGYWSTHTNPKAAAAGRRQLKAIARAALGRTTYSRQALVGARLIVSVKENDTGFAEVSRFKAINGQA